MKAYMVQNSKRVEPFGDHPSNCLILNKPLAAYQNETLRVHGWQVVRVPDASAVPDGDECLIFDESLFFTPEIIEDFVAKSRLTETSTVCALKRGTTTIRSIVPTQDVRFHPDHVEYNLWYIPRNGRRETSRPVVIEPDQLFEFLPMPEHMFGGRQYKIPLTDRSIVSIDHWTNLLTANILGVLANGARLNKAPKINLLWMALRARSLNQWRVLCQKNRIGSNCDIHPKAYIEGSIIGDSVKIGAGSVVRESVIGDGVFIGNNVTVELSVLGEKCDLFSGVVVQYSVLYPGAVCNARFLNVSILGRNTFLGGVSITDFRFDGKTVTVLKDGNVVDTENTFLGSGIGHGVYLGSGTILAPGMMIPNDYRLVPEKKRIVTPHQLKAGLPGYQPISAVTFKKDS
jgi:acetyltransferase-like isoleucine patch superfamily enzyme